MRAECVLEISFDKCSAPLFLVAEGSLTESLSQKVSPSFGKSYKQSSVRAQKIRAMAAISGIANELDDLYAAHQLRNIVY